MFVNMQNNSPYSQVILDREGIKYEILDENNLTYVPDSEQIIKEFVKDLNKHKPHCLARYYQWSFLLLIAYIISFILLGTTGNIKLFFLPIIIFIAFIVILMTGICLMVKHQKKLQKVVLSYNNKLNGKYTLQSAYNSQQIYYNRKRRYFSYQIRLIPIPGNQFAIGIPNYIPTQGFGQVYAQNMGQQQFNGQGQNNELFVQQQQQALQYYNNQNIPTQQVQDYRPDIPIQNNIYQQNQPNLPIYQVNLEKLDTNKQNAKDV